MFLIKRLSLQNFRCFRKTETFDLAQGTYLIGINNAGKSAVISAIRYFFDNSLYRDFTFLNRAEFLAKKAGYNKARLNLCFDLKAITTKSFREKLIKEYGDELNVTKIISYFPITQQITTNYEWEGKQSGRSKVDDTFPQDLQRLISGVKITYLHPQEGEELLLHAQEKLRQRLLANWGRGSSNVTRSLKDLQKRWKTLRESARKYLSSSLTQNIQNIWPASSVSIELPRDIRDILAISDIKFQGQLGSPEIELTSEGAGTQSTILYSTHYLLDSDRSLHRGEYHPVWLLEEPESFLHSDLIAKFARDLNSDSWLANIQMVVSTHSPIILAISRMGGNRIVWNLLKDRHLDKSALVTSWKDKDLKTIGKLMGDTNFINYFLAASKEKLVFLEDTRELTLRKLKQGGIPVTKGLAGTTEVSRYIDVFSSTAILNQNAFFIVDSDKGKKDLERYYQSKKAKERGAFKRYKIDDKIYLILLPEGEIIEDFFDEYDNHLAQCASKLWELKDWSSKKEIPLELTRTNVEKVRGKMTPKDMREAKSMIKNTQDVKDLFWKNVKNRSLRIIDSKARQIKELLQ